MTPDQFNATPNRFTKTSNRFILNARFVLSVILIGMGFFRTPCQANDTKPKNDDTRKGALLICGGGALPLSVKKKFVELAGGKNGKLVVIPTASERTSEKALGERTEFWTDAGIGMAKILHTRDRKVANSSTFVSELEDATAVWISGGQQSRLASAYQGTATEKALLDLVQRGGIVGGTSAGAAIQTRVMIQSGNPNPVISKGMDLLPNAIVDQHFLKRNRFNRLLTAVRQHPDRTGVGISESTALLYVDNTCEVLGSSFVIVVNGKKGSKPLSIQSFRSGQKFALNGQ